MVVKAAYRRKQRAPAFCERRSKSITNKMVCSGGWDIVKSRPFQRDSNDPLTLTFVPKPEFPPRTSVAHKSTPDGNRTHMVFRPAG